MEGIDFSDLVERSRALRSRQEASASGFADNIPRLERALPQIDRESRRLATGHSADTGLGQPGDARDAKALRLLSEYGFQTGNIERNLQNVALLDAFEPYKSVADTDLDAYLGQAHENAIVSAIEAALAHATKVSLSAMSSTIKSEWEASKRDLVTLGAIPYQTPTRKSTKAASTAPGGAFASPFRFPRGAQSMREPIMERSSLRSSIRTSTVSPTTPIYESIVRKAVHSRSNPNVSVAIATELDDALNAHHAPRGDILNGPRSIQHLHAVFTALRYITSEANAASPPPEGAFGGMYTAEDRRKSCIGAYRFLCLQFREDKMKREIELRPVEAKRGGVPGMKADVKAYLNLIFDRGVPDQLAGGTRYDGLPIWPQIYYCLRAGSRETALEIARGALRTGCTDASVTLIEQCLHASITAGERGALPEPLLERLVQDYGLSAQRGEDPYQRVCYVVLARLDPAAGDKIALPDSDYSLLFYSIEDYLWLRLSVVRLEGDEKAPDSLAMYQLSLRSIQEEVRSFGPSHFDPQGDTPAFYALVLLLTCQFAEAIRYLDRGARAIAEATHIAYTLYYYGMLRETVGLEATDDKDSDDACFRFDYAELLWRYISRFSRTDPTAAAVYLFTLRDGGVRKGLLRRLLLETKEFDLLLGSKPVRSGSRVDRQVGVLEELWPLGGRDAAHGGGWMSLVEDAAAAAEESGDRTSAVQLYDVAGVRGKVVAILIDKLSAELTSRDTPARTRGFEEATEYRRQLENDRINRPLERVHGDMLLNQLMPSFDLLLSMGEFFDLVWQKQFERAWELLDKVDFLPRNDAQLVAKTSELKVGGGVWADAVCDRVPEIVLGAMEVLAALHSMQRRSGREIGGTGLWSTGTLRTAARTLVNFSGMLPNVSADISARLVRLDVLMN